jgi:hypothetical protein
MIPSREQVSATSSKADSAGDDRDLSGEVDHACPWRWHGNSVNKC